MGNDTTRPDDDGTSEFAVITIDANGVLRLMCQITDCNIVKLNFDRISR